ncbi:hypothetical protein ACJ41O_014770 [Fusarium nematophilum]
MALISLADLPAEILIKICTALCDHCTAGSGTACENAFFCPFSSGPDNVWDEPYRDNKRDLASLCRTSRRLNAIASPVLYHFVLEASFTWDQPSLMGYVRAICRNPALGRDLKHAVIHAYVQVKPEHLPLIHEITKILRTELPDRWQDPKPDEEIKPHDPEDGTVLRVTRDSVRDENQIALRHSFVIDFLLSLAVNLEELLLEMSRATEFGDSMPASASLQSLKALRLRLADHYGARQYGLGSVAEVLKRAPNLHTLEAAQCSFVPTGLCLGGLKYVEFDDSLLGTGDVKTLASSCKGLETFIIRYGEPSPAAQRRRSGSHRILSPKELVKELEPCASSLRRLEMRVNPIWFGLPEFYRKNAITSLKQFSVLKHLSLDELYLCCGRGKFEMARSLLADLLPPSIERVTLGRVQSEFYGAAEDLCKEVRQGAFPSLSVVQFFKSPRRHTLNLVRWENGLIQVKWMSEEGGEN